MPIPLDPTAAEALATPAVPAFVPDRLWVRRVSIEVTRPDMRYAVSMTPCPGTATALGPADAAEVVSPDLIAELMAAPDTPERTAALVAVQQVAAGLVTVAGFLLALRE